MYMYIFTLCAIVYLQLGNNRSCIRDLELHLLLAYIYFITRKIISVIIVIVCAKPLLLMFSDFISNDVILLFFNAPTWKYIIFYNITHRLMGK